MRRRRLGTTGLEVSEISLGAWALGGPAELEGRTIGWGPADDEASVRAIHRAIDEGVDLIDTADVYGWGHSEEVVGRAIEGRRDRVVLATKVGNRRRDGAAGPRNDGGDSGGGGRGPSGGDPFRSGGKDFSPEWIREACEASLRRLRTDRIDLYQLHSPHQDFRYPDETWEAMEKLREQGKIRVAGVSVGHSSPHHIPGLLARGRARVLQIQIHALEPYPALDVLEDAARAGVGILARVPLASGLLTGRITAGRTFPEDDWRSRWVRAGELEHLVARAAKVVAAMEGEGGTPAQRAIRFLLSFPQISSVIVGMRSEEQARENAAASDRGPLGREAVRRVLALSQTRRRSQR